MAARAARSTDSISIWAKGDPSQFPNPSSPSAGADANRRLPSPLPVLNPASRSILQERPEMAPLTIFYNGMVTAFDVPRDKAEAIIRMAESGIMENPVEKPEDKAVVLLDGHQVEGDLPIARRKSLQRFLGKRKERVISEDVSVTDKRAAGDSLL